MKRDNLSAIETWKTDIKKSGDKAKDLSEYILKNRQFKKNNQSKDKNS